MSWNHRVIRHVDDKDEGEEWFSIHEVYYNDDLEPTSCTKDAIAPLQEEMKDLKWELEKMLECLEKPIIDYQYFLDIEKANEKEEDK